MEIRVYSFHARSLCSFVKRLRAKRHVAGDFLWFCIGPCHFKYIGDTCMFTRVVLRDVYVDVRRKHRVDVLCRTTHFSNVLPIK